MEMVQYNRGSLDSLGNYMDIGSSIDGEQNIEVADVENNNEPSSRGVMSDLLGFCSTTMTTTMHAARGSVNYLSNLAINDGIRVIAISFLITIAIALVAAIIAAIFLKIAGHV
ncbi:MULTISPECIES: hypothetical protein [Candidatus Ichthyocystis]|uniref:hypothetical protein n=1 Tax=Candidatus Ichthyocystis TaxID=2929841 RepID=UPI000B82876B|nr:MULTISPECIES: hypothetical protein [Ichthyocystis]